ncbi:MAG: prolyl oligopeptidase family serine peptidase [Phycisphaerae bacterium]
MSPKTTWAVVLALAALAAGLSAADRPSRASRSKKPPRGKTVKPPQKGKRPEADKRFEKAPDVYELMKLYEARQYNSVYGKMPYRLLKPLSYASSRRYPLVVCLHGVPGRGEDNALQLGCTYPVAVLAQPDMRRKYPAFVMAPQSPTWWGDRAYGEKKPAGGPGKPSGKGPPMMSMLLDGIEALAGVFSIDPNRVYVTGHSMGGFGAFNALASDPNMFAAAVVVAGGGDPNTAASFLHVPVWVFCGQKSSILHYSQNMVLALKKVGGRCTFTVLEGAGHRCWYQVYDAQATWDWLFAQRRIWPRPILTTWPATLPATQPTTRPILLKRE